MDKFSFKSINTLFLNIPVISYVLSLLLVLTFSNREILIVAHLLNSSTKVEMSFIWESQCGVQTLIAPFWSVLIMIVWENLNYPRFQTAFGSLVDIKICC